MVIERKISPEAYVWMTDALLLAQLEGRGPTESTRIALLSIGLNVSDGTTTHLIVDYSLKGVRWPFSDKPES